MASLAETFELVKQAEFESKLASLQEAWGEDDVRVELLDEAFDLVKQAQEAGQLPQMDDSQLLDLGVAMVEDALEGLETEDAAGEGAADASTADEGAMDKQAAAELGQAAGELLAELGLTKEALENMPEAEAEELGRLVAQELVSRQG